MCIKEDLYSRDKTTKIQTHPHSSEWIYSKNPEYPTTTAMDTVINYQMETFFKKDNTQDIKDN